MSKLIFIVKKIIKIIAEDVSQYLPEIKFHENITDS